MPRDFKPIIKQEDILVYTCQSPKLTELKKNWIEEIGENFGLPKKEALKIPKRAFEKYGIRLSKNQDVVTLQAESLLKKLS